jgi:two-component system alkaline phosphatase synthesis response regulator PhoP
MDIMMPNMDGVEAGRRLRELPELQNTYIIFLTARTEEYSEVAAFEVGADDYITKPIKPRALMSRISALFRRETKKAKQEDKIAIGDLTIDRKSYTVSNKGELVTLPKKEFELLFFLAQNPTKCSAATICSRTSGAATCTCWPAPWTCTSGRCAKRSAKATSKRSKAWGISLI